MDTDVPASTAMEEDHRAAAPATTVPLAEKPPATNRWPVGEEVDLDEQRRTEATHEMKKMEREFEELKEKMYAEEDEKLRAELAQIQGSTHPLFVSRLGELDERRAEKIWAAEQWRNFQMTNINNVYESEMKQAQDEHNADINALRERLNQQIMEKQRQLELEKRDMKLGDAGGGDARAPSRQQPRRGGGASKRNAVPDAHSQSQRRHLNPPNIAYTLKDTEIDEDLSAILHGNVSAMSTEDSAMASSSSSSGGVADVWVDQTNQLHYRGSLFEKGNTVVISDVDGNRFIGALISITPSEIQLRLSEGGRHRLPVAQLKLPTITLSAI